MRTATRPVVVVALLALLLTLVACSKPKPPTLVPKSAQMIAMDPNGITFELSVEMTNPNRFTLAVQSVTARVVLEGVDLGEVRIPQALTLPPNAPTLVKVPMNVRWAGVAALTATAMSGKDLPFTVNGTVAVGGEKLNVELPFSVHGVITQEEMRRATFNALGNLPLPAVPGFPSALPPVQIR